MAREVAAALGQKPRRPEAKTLGFDRKSPIAIELNAGRPAPQFYRLHDRRREGRSFAGLGRETS